LISGVLKLRILFVGDVVGRSGRNAIAEYLPGMVKDWSLDFVVVNGENSAGGFGITEAIYQEFLDAGADAVTLGNHSWDQREALVFIERAERLVLPANYPRGTPGRGAALVETKNGKHALVVNALGRVFMTPFDDPFAALERELGACPLGVAADAIVVDFHCEASSEKQGVGFFSDGRASLVVGTHTHVPTADHQILTGGTAYMTDAGMTGDYDSIIGMQKEEPLRRFTSGIPSGRFEPAVGVATLSGVAIETDDATGLALKIAPVRVGGRLEPATPKFWLS
jgi:metallophosphoesterase (TIGR00282 family)